MRYTKLLILALSCLLLLSLAACDAKENHNSIDKNPVNDTQENGYILDMDSALEIAIEIARATSDEEFTETCIVQTEKNGKCIYLITFEDSTTYHEYDIDATNGKVLRGKRKGKPTDMPIFSFVIPTPGASPEPAETTAE